MIGCGPLRKCVASRDGEKSYACLVIHAVSSLRHKFAVGFHVALVNGKLDKCRMPILITACLLEVIRKLVQVLVIRK